MTATNPWDSRESELGLRLGDPARVLTIGWKHGLHAITSLQEGEADDESQVMEISSIQRIQQLKEIASLTSEIHQLEVEMQQRLLDRDTADLMHVDQLKDRLARVDGFLCHMTQVVQGKDALLGQLQARVSDHSLKIEASCQRPAHRVIKVLGPSIQDHPAQLTSMTWTEQLNICSTPLLDVCHQGEESLIYCQATYRTMDELHRIQQEIATKL